MALDGPVLPTPAWKAVIEVRDPERLEQTLERIDRRFATQAQDKGAHASIECEQGGRAAFYRVQIRPPGNSRGIHVCGWLHDRCSQSGAVDGCAATHSTGDSLARSAPSGLCFQRIRTRTTLRLHIRTEPGADAIAFSIQRRVGRRDAKLAADSRPTVICAWGKDAALRRPATAACSVSISSHSAHSGFRTKQVRARNNAGPARNSRHERHRAGWTGGAARRPDRP